MRTNQAFRICLALLTAGFVVLALLPGADVASAATIPAQSPACMGSLDNLKATMEANPVFNDAVANAIVNARTTCGDTPAGGLPPMDFGGGAKAAASTGGTPENQCVATEFSTNAEVDGAIIVTLPTDGNPVFTYRMPDHGIAEAKWNPTMGTLEYIGQATVFGLDAFNTGTGTVSIGGVSFPATTTASGQCNAAGKSICSAQGAGTYYGTFDIAVTSSFADCPPS